MPFRRAAVPARLPANDLHLPESILRVLPRGTLSFFHGLDHNSSAHWWLTVSICRKVQPSRVVKSPLTTRQGENHAMNLPSNATVNATVNAIVVDGVTKRYGQHVAVDNLTFEVRSGEIFSMLGPTGAGKATTIRLIPDSLNPDGGPIQL